MLWFLLTLAMIAAAAAVAWPFLKRTSVADGASSDIYKAQLAEIDREESAGLMSGEDARMARTEIQRRLIATTGASSLIETSDMTLTDRTTFIAVAASIAIGSAVLYMTLGAPGAMPVSHPQITAQNMSGMAASAMNAPAASGSGAMSVAPVDEMIGSLETRLKAEPNDVEGWRMLGWSKFRTDDFAGAAAAYAQAVKLAPGDAETQSSYGESLSRAAGGLVTEDAARALQAALKANPADPRARFLLGLKKEQAGKPQEALNDWLALLESANANDPWYDEVRGRVVELSQSSGIDVSQRLPAARNTASAPPLPMASAPTGPTAAQVSEAAAMTPEARQAMIDGMVGRLEQRLKQNPNDLDGWLKLIRSYRVLGRTDLAAKAATDGQAQFASDKAAANQLKAAMLEPISN
jgi:cytochrome c-type biogenesis protein CcmH